MKTFYLSLTGALLALSLISCSGGSSGSATSDAGNSSSNDKLLVGTWLEIALNGVPEENPSTDVYKSDGTVTSVRRGCDIGGTWSTSGNKMMVTITTQAPAASVYCADVGTETTDTFTVDSTTLNVSGTAKDNVTGATFDYTLTYQRQ